MDIGLALSGSGFKFPAHVGALKALQDAGYNIVELAGTSGGSIIAGLYACGMSVLDMQDLTMSRNWSDMLCFNPWSLLTRMGYCAGNELLAFLDEQTMGRTFATCPIDLKVFASDIAGSKVFEFSKAATPDVRVATACRASAAIPFVYAPVKMDGALLMDGGLVNNIAVDKLSAGAVRLGIQLVSAPVPLKKGLHTVFDIAPRIIDLMLSSNEDTHVEAGLLEGGEVVFVETGYASGLDRNMSPEIREKLFDAGYAAVKAWSSKSVPSL